jgi:pantoate--beta-alanine ligase
MFATEEKTMESRKKPRSNPRPIVVRTVTALKRAVAGLRGADETLALVPTMGALHDGHMALVTRASRRCDHVAVSIFVNPTQFSPNEDLSSYPRTFDADMERLTRAGVALVWAPTPQEMYPHGFATMIVPEGAATAGLEDKFRPTHFAGVATVVAKLFNQVTPDAAFFGEKDFQQLKMLSQLVLDLDMPVKVLGVPIVREKDGLARSSRNVYLSPQERAAAPALHQALRDAARQIADGTSLDAALKNARQIIETAGFVIDYVEARHAETLAPVHGTQDGPLRLLVAARIGKTRLIDNLAV